MQVESLEIIRRGKYDDEAPGQLVGMVSLKSNLGTQQIRITNQGLAKIFEVIKEEVANTARENASRTKNALNDAMHEPIAISATEIKSLESSEPF